jgi:hypothetical protein
MDLHLPDIEAHVSELIEAEMYGDAINCICRAVQTTFRGDQITGKFLYYPKLDQLACSISNHLYACIRKTDAEASDLTVVLATNFLSVGGHTRVAAGIANQLGNVVILLTDIHNHHKNMNPATQGFEELFGSSQIFVSPHYNLLDTTLWTCLSLLNLNPKRIICFNNFEDAPAVIASVGAPRSQKFYYHHCDFNPSLGASIREFIHVDTTEFNKTLCTNHNAFEKAYNLPLHPTGKQVIKSRSYQSFEPLNFISVAQGHKYCFGERETSYPFFLKQLLNLSPGVVFHVGNLLPEFRTDIMTKLGKDLSNRFIYLGDLKELFNITNSIKNPVFLPSFPIPGGLTAVEMLAYGIPFIAWKRSGVQLFNELSFEECIPRKAPRWSNLHDLARCLESCSANYDMLSQASVDLYMRNFSELSWSIKFREIFSQEP